MILKVGQNQVNLIERRGIKFFKPFWAIDKTMEPVKIHYNGKFGVKSRIFASNEYGRTLGVYDLHFIKKERTIKAPLLNVDEDEHGRGLGQILTLSGLIELFGNNWNTFKLFSLKRTMGFHANLGFKLDTDDADYILEGLKYIKGKPKVDAESARKAAFFLPKVKNYEEVIKQDPFILRRGADVISEFMKFITRRGQKKYMPPYMCGSDFKFTDWEFVTERDFLNKLLEKYKIGFKF